MRAFRAQKAFTWTARPAPTAVAGTACALAVGAPVAAMTLTAVLWDTSGHLVRKGGEGVLEPVTWRDPLLVVSARRCLSPCPNPSPALRASFGFKPISSVYLSIYVENYQNKLP
eukprot:COSAG01_NODE_39553_length_475_cov_0.765957_1_plen_113_part_01